jgi:hypothetical protein
MRLLYYASDGSLSCIVVWCGVLCVVYCVSSMMMIAIKDEVDDDVDASEIRDTVRLGYSRATVELSDKIQK